MTVVRVISHYSGIITTLIFSIPSSQAENDRGFSLAGIYSFSRHERLSRPFYLSTGITRSPHKKNTFISSRDQQIIYNIKFMIWRAVLTDPTNQTPINKKPSKTPRKYIIASVFV